MLQRYNFFRLKTFLCKKAKKNHPPPLLGGIHFLFLLYLCQRFFIGIYDYKKKGSILD